MAVRVLRSYQAQYPDPIKIRKGERVTLGMRDGDFPGWIWATSVASGKSGWMPEQFLSPEGDGGRALRDYSARELSVEEGEMVTVLEELLGWAMVESASGNQGWIPLDHIARGISPSDIPL